MRSKLAGVALLCGVLFWGVLPLAAQELEFVRGDVNQDGRVDLSDPVSVLFHLFLPGHQASCEKAADINDDGSVQIADAVFALQYLFAGGPAPFAPFPYCGDDPTPDGLGCAETLCGLGTPEVVLSARCTADPEVELGWEITNLESWTVNLDWELAGTAQSGTLSISPLGTVVHTTPRVPGVNELVLYYVGEEVGRLAQVRVIISEIMASNALTLDDEDGDSSDWIEIHLVNDPCTHSIDLENWCLTDDPAEPRKWRFPKVTLEAGGYVLVFASDKDRRVAGSELHTNFALAEEGEYLALLAEDGVTVVDEFDPSYPEQLTDVSYGLAQSTTSFVKKGNQALYHLPTSADAALGDDWTNVGYTPSGWRTGATGLGFTGIATEGFEVTYIKANVLVDYLTDAQDVLNDPAKQAQVVTETAAFIDFFNTGDSGNYANDLAFPGLTYNDVDDFVVHVTGTVLIPTTGAWSFGVNSDDGFGLSITNGSQTFSMEYPDPRGPGDTIQVFNFTQAGPYEVDLLFYERGGGAELEFFAAQGSHGSFSYEYFDLVGDTTNGGLSLLGFASEIATDVGAEMRNVNASLWVRMGFNVDDAGALGGLLLRMKYEDGFVAYLNGEVVARRNAPAQLAWNSRASSDRPVENAPVFEEINLATYLHLLQNGQNVLGIHGLNDAASDGDFLILPELIAASKESEVNYMEKPTPGTFNVSGTVDFVRAVEFNPKRGFYNSSFLLSLSTPTSGAQIRYTLDGSTPTSTTGTAYTTPITVSKTSVIRAGAFKPNYLASRVVTNTYIFLTDVIRQSPTGAAPGPAWPAPGRVNDQIIDYGMDPDIVNNAKWSGVIVEALRDIPTISLVTDLGNLFNPTTGIYVNAWNDGRAWERPTSAELIYPDGTQGFGIDAGLRIRGAFSRSGDNPKHAFRLFFRNQYGPGKLAYPLFGGEGFDEFDKVDLRTSQNYSWAFEGSTKNTFLRDVFSRDVQRDMGRPYTRSRYYHLYINGHYWGLYQTQERADADYASSYLHGHASEYDAIKNDSSGSRALHATDGNMEAYQRLYDRAVAGFSSAQAYLAVLGLKPDGTPDPNGERLLDPVNVMDYMICTYYTGDPDAPVSCWAHFSNNVFAIYNRVYPKGFTWYRHDAEHSLGANGGLNEGRLLTDPTDQTIGQEWRHFNPAWLHRRLTANQEYLIQFADRVNKCFSNGGILTSQPNIDRWLARADQIDLAIIAESARWGDSKVNPPRTKDDWQAEVNYMVNTYFPQRTQIVIGQMRSQDMFPDLAVVSFNQHGGEVAPGFELTMSQGNGTPGTIYYTIDGSDPRLKGGGINPAAAIFEDETSGVSLIARGSVWRFKDDGSNQGTAWRELSFSDTGWAQGPAQLGYGEGDEATVVSYGPNANDKYETTYFRHKFNVTNASSINELTLGIVRDDGAVVYLNGVEAIPRINMDAGEITFETLANATVDGADESTFHTFSVDPDLLLEGTNVVAVEIHQVTRRSSDISFDLELTGIVSGTASPPVILSETTTVKARVYGGGQWGAATSARFTIGLKGLVINEIMASNHLTLEDPDEPGEFPDWIEIYNGTAGTIDLDGMYLTDDLQDLTKWRIDSTKWENPPDLTIPANGYLIFYADDDGTQGAYHTNYKLGRGGDSIALVDVEGETIIDSLIFDSQLDDVSYGRFPDGGVAWGFHQAASPGSANLPHTP